MRSHRILARAGASAVPTSQVGAGLHGVKPSFFWLRGCLPRLGPVGPVRFLSCPANEEAANQRCLRQQSLSGGNSLTFLRALGQWLPVTHMISDVSPVGDKENTGMLVDQLG